MAHFKIKSKGFKYLCLIVQQKFRCAEKHVLDLKYTIIFNLCLQTFSLLRLRWVDRGVNNFMYDRYWNFPRLTATTYQQ